MDIRECLPRDKFDYEAVRKLSEFSDVELKLSSQSLWSGCKTGIGLSLNR